MTRRRLTAVAVAAALLGGLGTAHVAAADSGAEEPVDVRSMKEKYWACVAVDHVEIGACIENPFPDMSGYPSVPQLLDQLLPQS